MVVRARGLSHLGVKVRDLSRALAFYERVLGFRIVLDQRGGVLPGHETVLGAVGATEGHRGVLVELIHDDGVPADAAVAADGVGWSCVCLRVDDLDAALTALRDDGVEVIGPIEFPAARTLFFRDPDGNLLELIDADLVAPTRQSADARDPVAGISAVTLVTTDMARSVAFYESLGLRTRYGGRDSEFTSFHVGDGYLNIQHDPSWTPSEPVWGRVIVYVDDVDAMHERARAAGHRPETEPADAPWGERYFHLRDPDGHELSFARLLPSG